MTQTDIEFVELEEIDEAQLVTLMNDARVRRHLPLLAGEFSRDDCRAFVAAKRRLWTEHGQGPWAILVHGEFAGWGGVQPEHGEADLALVLDPRFWGWGGPICRAIVARAFDQMELGAITALLPPSRVNRRAITRLGFVEAGRSMIEGRPFIRFLLANTRQRRAPDLAASPDDRAMAADEGSVR